MPISRHVVVATLLSAMQVVAFRKRFNLTEARLEMDDTEAQSSLVEEAQEQLANQSGIPKGTISGEGWLCHEIPDVKKPTEQQVEDFMRARGQVDAYEVLKVALRNAPKGTWGAWKGSNMDRVLFAEGEKSWNEKNISMMLTKEWGFWRSVFKVCFADQGVHLGSGSGADIMSRVYADGAIVRTTCHGGRKVMPPGVAGQQLYSGKRSLPNEMTNEVYKQLYTKDALVVHKEYSDRILSRPNHNWWSNQHVDRQKWDQLTTEVSKNRFATKREGIYWNRRVSVCDSRRRGGPTTHVYNWLEYANWEQTGDDYMPEESRWALDTAVAWAMCHRNPKVAGLAKEADMMGRIPKIGCGQAVGARNRNSVPYPGCKCGYWTTVRCGETFVGERKFNMSELLGRPECLPGNMYCGRSPCPGLLGAQ